MNQSKRNIIVDFMTGRYVNHQLAKEEILLHVASDKGQ